MKNYFYLLLLLGFGCSDDDQSPAELFYDCIDESTTSEIFIVTESPPSFGITDTDLYDYIVANMNIAEIDQVDEGIIHLELLVYVDGAACLASVTSDDVAEVSLTGYKNMIDNMPVWTPGQQGEIDRITRVEIMVVILAGEITEVDQL